MWSEEKVKKIAEEVTKYFELPHRAMKSEKGCISETKALSIV